MSRRIAWALVMVGCSPRPPPIVQPPPLDEIALPADAAPDAPRATATGPTQLARAAAANDAVQVHNLLISGVAVDAVDAARMTPLGYAAGGCSVDAVRALLAGGADPQLCRPTARDGNCTTAEIGAAPAGDYPLLLAQRTALQRGDKPSPLGRDCAEVVRILTPLTDITKLKTIR